MDKNAAETSPGASAVTAEKVENTVTYIHTHTHTHTHTPCKTGAYKFFMKFSLLEPGYKLSMTWRIRNYFDP